MPSPDPNPNPNPTPDPNPNPNGTEVTAAAWADGCWQLQLSAACHPQPTSATQLGVASSGQLGETQLEEARLVVACGALLGANPTPTPTPAPNPNPNPQTHPHPNSNSHPNASGGGWAASLVRDAGLPERLVRGACMRSARYAVHTMRCTLCGAWPCHARHIP